MANTKANNMFFPVPTGWIMTSGYSRISSGDFNHTQDLNGDDTYIKGYRTNGLKRALYILLNLLFLGIPALLTRWYPHWKIKFTCDPSSLNAASVVLVKDENKTKNACKVEIKAVDFISDEFASQSASERNLQHQNSRTPLCDSENAGSVYRYFEYRNEKFIWDDAKDMFKKIEGLVNLTCKDLLSEFAGMCPNRRDMLKTIFGTNEILVDVKSYPTLLFDEVVNPFYMFQTVSVVLWCFDEYYLYAVCVILLSGFSIGAQVYKTKQQSITLREMASGGDNLVTVRLPTGEETEIRFQDLVPGDVFLVPAEGCIMPCDAVIVEGSCIVNESMLTGESVPINKTGLQSSDELFSSESHKKHVIFAGTQVIQTRYYKGSKVACVVIRTGFATQKGQLIRSIMYPKEVDFKFYLDSMKFVFMLFVVALFGTAYSIYLYIVRGTSVFMTIIRALDIVTIVVPPALPAAMTVGTLNAQGRLRRKNIFCISPQRINFCGKLKLICFDKTGTLTEDGLNLSCVVPVTTKDEEHVENQEFEEAVTNPKQLPLSSPLLRGMAACHSLTQIGGNVVGDPLDMKMFESTGWSLNLPENRDETSQFDTLETTFVTSGDVMLGIVKEYDFTPQLQRMSVVVRDPQDLQKSQLLFCKGAPERIRPLCKSVPENYDKVLDSFTLKGYRVLGMGWKTVERMSWHKVQKIPREKMESDLNFAGFLVMQNNLKPATIPVIKELNSASIRCVMVTGDNMLTALSVARECGMVPAHDKVVIVNANDDGQLEYTLAAQHTEISDEDTSTPNTSRLSNNNGEGEVGFEPAATTPLLRRLSKRFSLDSNPDTMIDMEKLIPIGSDLLKDSNYHLALTGKTWTFLQQNCSKSEFEKIISKGTVFARMSPECKMQLVESLQELDYVVAMCGDGANDCSALSTAHVGVSLSEAEASVAAPFTSKTADVSCIPVLIQEGRCALVTSFGIFKYMALYSMVQFASVLILYSHYTNLADAQFLWIDLAITSTVTIAMGRTEPVRRLVSKRPMGSLVSFKNVFSIFSQIIVCVVVQLCAMEVLKAQTWFKPLLPPADPDELQTLCWETTTVFSISSFQYLIMSVVFSKGRPFRKPFYLNSYLLAAIVILTGFTALLMVYPVSYIGWFFSLEPVSPNTQAFRYMLIAFPTVNTIISVLMENIVSVSKPVKWFGKRCWRKGQPCRYKEVLSNLQKDRSWPPVRA